MKAPVSIPARNPAAHRLKLLKRETVRLQNHASKLEHQLNTMIAKKKAIRRKDLKAKIALLLAKQREAKLNIFKVATRESTRDIRYPNQWVLECLIMKMKSSQLYEYLRKEQVLALPSKTTLQKYLKCYKTGFGFSEKVLDVIRKKVSAMDGFSRHRGFIVDINETSKGIFCSHCRTCGCIC
ncbi:hypothetical protein HPB48_000075 [Haemaphysalis longicornis]|uniref:Transposase n=1 Tax=Haemaphysalis longicornis TaxID=44386 RepID=A0A9J6GAA6_HAELO|nr:hypothetical protein HPB48_000075 [Haemaphysalis longicornis]